MQDEKNTQEQAPKRDLLSELSQVTEHKTPSADTVKSWNFGDDDDDEPEDETEADEPKPKETKKASTLSPRENRIAAEASANGVDLLTSVLCEAIVNIRYYRKFTPEERERLDEKILDTDEKKLNEEEKFLLNKWNRRMKERDRKLKNISGSDKQRERLINSFELYQEQTGKTILTPGYMLGIAVGESIIKAGIEAFLD